MMVRTAATAAFAPPGLASLVDSDGQSFVVARELKKGDKVVELRDQQGVPVWGAGTRSR